MIFQFVMRRLHFLARVPLAAHVFDALLLTWTALFHRERLRAIESIEEFAQGLPGVELARHRYGGTGFRRGQLEFAHVHGNGLLDIHLTRALAEDALQKTRALPHHVLGKSAWVSLWLNSMADADAARNLLRAAAFPPKSSQVADAIRF